ncbi:uncharacterized protein LOC111674349, partial [Orussus abietinus]|uniref:uncharacterized protein LOC111674349 n=1 Tax=Orussus abietinus TaxID=222816 RepID=UPI000C715CF8
LSDLLASEDSYLRGRVAITFTALARYLEGRNSILKNVITVSNLAKGLEDHLAVVRIQMAKTIEMLSRYWPAAEDLCTHGFVDLIVEQISREKKDILLVHLESLQSLLSTNVKIHAIEIGTMEKLVDLLKRKDEAVLSGSLACLIVLCQEPMGKQKSIDMDLLSILKEKLNDPVWNYSKYRNTTQIEI